MNAFCKYLGASFCTTHKILYCAYINTYTRSLSLPLTHTHLQSVLILFNFFFLLCCVNWSSSLKMCFFTTLL